MGWLLTQREVRNSPYSNERRSRSVSTVVSQATGRLSAPIALNERKVRRSVPYVMCGCLRFSWNTQDKCRFLWGVILVREMHSWTRATLVRVLDDGGMSSFELCKHVEVCEADRSMR